ncbi:MAG: MFS transporter [Chloroflexi bacterium]|nr:MFS transporter [Chloroflexota bacterium]
MTIRFPAATRSQLQATAQTYAREVRSFSPISRNFLVASSLGGINAGVTSVLLNLYILSLGNAEGDLGRLLSLGSLGAAMGALIGAQIADKWSSWVALMLGTVIAGSGLLIVLIPGLNIFLSVGTFLGGLGTVTIYLAVPPFLASHSQQSNRPYLFGIAGASYVVSTAIGSILGGFLPAIIRAAFPGTSQADIYRLSLAFGVACSAIGVPFLWRARPTKSGSVGNKDRGSDQATPSRMAGTLVALDKVSWASVIRDPIVRLILARFVLTDGLIRLGGNLIVPFFSVYFVRELGASEAWFGTLRVIERSIEVIAMLAIAPVASRFGPVATIALSQLASVPMLLGLGFAPSLGIASGIFLIRGTLMEMTVPLRDNFMMDRLPPGSRATVSAAVLLFGYAIAFFSVRVGGQMVQVGHRDYTYMISGALYTISAVLFFRLFRNQSTEKALVA